MSTTSLISENAPYHSNLLHTIASLDYVPSALANQISYLSSLHLQLGSVNKKVEELGRKTKKERKEHEEVRDSVAKKFVYRVTGRREKFCEIASREEREYVDALELEMRERKSKEMIEQMIGEGKTVQADLEAKQRQYKSLLTQLDDLYANIFDGRTVEFPRDDELENNLSSAKAAHDSLQAAINTESQALGLLRKADEAMNRATHHVQQALIASQWDMYGGSGMADYMERSSLGSAGWAAKQAQMLVDQARSVSANVERLEATRPPEVALMGDIFFDNIFSDYQAHKKIEAYAHKLAEVQSRLKSQISNANRYTNTLGHDLHEAALVLEQCRKELNDFRRETFFRVAGGRGGDGDGEPPAYGGLSLPPPPPGGETVMMGYAPPTGPPPGAGASSSSSYSSPPPTGPSMPSIPQPSHSHSRSHSRSPSPSTSTSAQVKYTPPAGPPPGFDPRLTTPFPAAAAQPTLGKELEGGEGGDHEGGGKGGLQWGSRNPYAAALAANHEYGSSTYLRVASGLGTSGVSPSPAPSTSLSTSRTEAGGGGDIPPPVPHKNNPFDQ